MRSTARLLTAVLSLSLFACSSAPTDEGSIGKTDEAIAWGQNDQYADPVAQAKADVVVLVTNSFAGCSGTLIAPRVVVTARHCVRGSVNETNAPGYFDATTSTVVVGSQGSTAQTTKNSATGSVIPTFNAAIDAQNRNDTATDAALVILPQGRFITSGLYIERPSFSVGAPTADYAAGFAPENGGTNDVRQIGFFTFLSAPIATGTSSYLQGVGPAATRRGDSGGPLFSVRADGTRDLRGITSAGDNGKTSYFADTSSVYLRGWIDSNSQDRTRTSGWLARHGKVAGSFWYGEADYTGTCQTSTDPDCDYWVGAHDDCPTTFNPDQLEAPDDGIGDACTPFVSSLTPSSGGNAGGYTISVQGDNFDTTGKTQIAFGSTPGTGVRCTTSNLCTVTVPGGGYDTFAQTTDVRVTVAGIASVPSVHDVFTYTAGPSCTSSFSCTGKGFGFPFSVATCTTPVNFYELAGTPSQELVGSGTTYSFDTNDVGVGGAACSATTGSCSVINTYEASASYCGSAKPPPPPLKCDGFAHPPTTCSVGWRCCGTDGWACGVCE